MPSDPQSTSPQIRRGVDARAQPMPALLVSAAHSLCDDGRTGEALEVARLVVRDHPRYSAGHVAMGRALFEAGDEDKAGDVLRAASIHYPASVAAHRWLAEVLIKKGSLARARAVLKQAQILSPRNQRINQLLRLAGAADPPAGARVHAERLLLGSAEEETTTRVMEFPRKKPEPAHGSAAAHTSQIEKRTRQRAKNEDPDLTVPAARVEALGDLPGNDDPTVASHPPPIPVEALVQAVVSAAALPTNPPWPRGTTTEWPTQPDAHHGAAAPLPGLTWPERPSILETGFETTPSVTWRFSLPPVAGWHPPKLKRWQLATVLGCAALLVFVGLRSGGDVKEEMPAARGPGWPSSAQLRGVAAPRPAAAIRISAPIPASVRTSDPIWQALDSGNLNAVEQSLASNPPPRVSVESDSAWLLSISLAETRGSNLSKGDQQTLQKCVDDKAPSAPLCLRLLATHNRKIGNRGVAKRQAMGLPAFAAQMDDRGIRHATALLFNLGERDGAARLWHSRPALQGDPALTLAHALAQGAPGTPTSLADPNPEIRLLHARATLAQGGPRALALYVAKVPRAMIMADDDLRWFGVLARHGNKTNATRAALRLRKSTDNPGPVASYVAGILAGPSRRLAMYWLTKALDGHGDACQAADLWKATLKSMGRSPSAAERSRLQAMGCKP